MSFIKKIWKNRITEYPNRRILTKQDNSSEIVTVGRSEGVISQEGDAFSAENMNDLEDRIDNAFSNLSNDSVVLADSNPDSGSIKFGITPGGQYGYIKEGADSVTPFRNPTGNALASHVLEGKTFSSANLENAVGTMPNHGSVTLTPTGNNTVSGDPGYYSEIIADGGTAYQAGKTAMTVSGNVSSNIFSRSTTGAISYTIPINNSYKYVLVMCSDADGGNNSTGQATMTGTLFSKNAPTTSNTNPGYSWTKIIIGLSSISHNFSWPKDSWDFTHKVDIFYFG